MKSRYYIALLVGLVFTGLIAFNLGRRIEAARLTAEHRRPNFEAQPSATPLSSPHPGIEKLADVEWTATASFAEMFDAVRFALPEQRAKALTNLTQLPDSPRRSAAIRSACRILIQADPSAATQAIGRMEDRELQALAIDVSICAAPLRALPQLADLVAAIPEEVRWDHPTDYLRFIIRKWSVGDPQAVAKFLERLQGAEHERASYNALLMRNWAAMEPEAAEAWIPQALGNEPEYAASISATLRNAWIEGLLEYDRSAALNYVISHQGGNDAGRAIESVANTLYLQSPQEARAFVDRLTDPATKRDALEAISRATADWEYHDALDQQCSPKTVADWLLQFPPQVWSSGISNVVDTWRRRDREALFAWIEQLPDVQRSAVAANYPAESGEDTLPEINRVAALPDRRLRDQLLEGMLRNSKLLWRDETLAALEKSDLPPDQKARLRSLVPSR